MVMVMGLVSFLFSVGIVFGPSVGFLFQFLEIRSQNHCEGFSPVVCFIMLTSNFLRLFFWIGERFDIDLLLQSVVMLTVHVVLLNKCVEISRNSSKTKEVKRFTDFHVRDFWQWSYMSDYMHYMFVLGCFASVVCIVGIDNPWCFDVLGMMAFSVEACLALPQIYCNYVHKSTHGLNTTMVATWLSGDIFKVVYFSVNAAPAQFVICSSVQVLSDLVVFYQMYVLYPDLTPEYQNLPTSLGRMNTAVKQ